MSGKSDVVSCNVMLRTFSAFNLYHHSMTMTCSCRSPTLAVIYFSSCRVLMMRSISHAGYWAIVHWD